MRILLINNGSIYIDKLRNILKEYEVEEKKLSSSISFENFDCVILSGGSIDLTSSHPKEIEVIKKCKIPIFGICLGFQMICKLFGSKLERMEKRRKGFVEINVKDSLFGIKKMKVYKNHIVCVREVPEEFEILGFSDDGIEIAKHKRKEIWGVQFHPEMGGDGIKVLKYFLSESLHSKN